MELEGSPTGVYKGALVNEVVSASSFRFFHISTHANIFFRTLTGTLALRHGYMLRCPHPSPSPGQSKPEVDNLPFLFTLILPSKREPGMDPPSRQWTPSTNTTTYATCLSCQRKPEVWSFIMEMATL